LRIALGLAYDGAGSPGWQTQPGGAALQDRLEASLAQLSGHEVATVCAGRTDAGVHALSQVVHFDTSVDRPLNAWVRGTNARLPECLRVQWARPVNDEFHARFSALSRSYRYLLLVSPVMNPLWAKRAGWVFQPLDLAAMQVASAALVGEHDFSAFRSSQCQARSPVRRISQLDVKQRGEFVEFIVTANAFLHHMVRNLVGTLVQVGLGRKPPEWAAQVLAARDRALAAATFSPAGLYLAGVDYGPQAGLPSPGLRDPLLQGAC
jgi:tRNA pseudouridine38-40 synthase